jgi:hypothetical protein
MADGLTSKALKILSQPFFLGVVFLALSVVGCSSHRPNMPLNGSLKTALSQVQFENETLKAKIAKLEKQNRMLAGDLQREESYSGTLAARLDESRNILKRNGVGLPMDDESPSVIARADDSQSSNKVTFGQVSSTRPRRSKYADWPDEDETPENRSNDDIPANDKPTYSKPKSLRPPGFPDDPEPDAYEVPELSANDLSTGWRRLSYRDRRVETNAATAAKRGSED